MLIYNGKRCSAKRIFLRFIHAFYTLAEINHLMKAVATAPKTWSRTKNQHLYRHKSGVYYARLFIGGKVAAFHFSIAWHGQGYWLACPHIQTRMNISANSKPRAR
ncbi:MAG: hypothetical protein U1B30_04315 [Pseudomonadota bacterium]|nr:hypothetical protein [Pseudomonadota bacterium]